MKKRKESEKMHLLSEETALNRNVTAEIKECLYEPPHSAHVLTLKALQYYVFTFSRIIYTKAFKKVSR